MGTPLALVVALLLPTALGGAVLVGARLTTWYSERRRRASVQIQPIEALGADLRRLHSQLDAAENQPPAPGKGLRIRALRGAYVDVLCTACQRLGVPAPRAIGSDRVPLTEIYRVEAALRERGLDVRRPVTS